MTVIIVRGLPAIDRVAGSAIVVEIVGCVIRVRHFRQLGLMATVAVVRRACVMTVGVAFDASHSLMSAQQLKARQIVVKCGWTPALDGVALLAGRGEVTGRVIRIGGLVVIGLMAFDTGTDLGLIAGCMTEGAVGQIVSPGQREG